MFDAAGQLQYTDETLRVAARLTLSEVLSCRRNASNSGIVARVAGDAIEIRRANLLRVPLGCEHRPHRIIERRAARKLLAW